MKVRICSKNLMKNSVCECLLFLIQVIMLCTLFSGIYEKEHCHERSPIPICAVCLCEMSGEAVG
jgi:hypothetical protein